MNIKKVIPWIVVLALVIFLGVYFSLSAKKRDGQKVGTAPMENSQVEDASEKTSSAEAKPPTQADSSATLNTSIKQQANIMLRAFMDKDFEKFSLFTHPKLVELFGGKETYVQYLQQSMSGPEAPVFLKASIGEPSKIIHAGSELQAVVPEFLEIQAEGGKVVINASLIALSSDNGKNWYFIDTAVDLDKLKMMFPNLSKDIINLVVSNKKEPVFYAD